MHSAVSASFVLLFSSAGNDHRYSSTLAATSAAVIVSSLPITSTSARAMRVRC